MNHTSPGQRLLTLIGVYLSLAGLYLRPVQAEDMETIRTAVRNRFPTVRQLSTAELSAWLADANRPLPLLVDVRAGGEFQVSHLRGAVHLTSVKEIKGVAAGAETPVVAYCSVGYRSAALVAQLRQAGFTNVWNLEGSIFAWANEGRPVFRGTNAVREVHPYSAKWGKMLQPQFHSRKP